MKTVAAAANTSSGGDDERRGRFQHASVSVDLSFDGAEGVSSTTSKRIVFL